MLLQNCQIVYLGVRRLEKNNSVALIEFHSMPASLWLVISLTIQVFQEIISEFQKHLKKLRSLKIPYEFDQCSLTLIKLCLDLKCKYVLILYIDVNMLLIRLFKY